MEETVMNLSEEITKEVFENFVPAAKTPERQTSVFNRMGDFITTAYNTLVKQVIGEEFLEQAEKDLAMKTEMLRHICISAFLSAVRSLDLVLTATGFGVVSTDSVVPASQQRVDFLVESLKTQRLLAYSSMLDMLVRIEGWGESQLAKMIISNIFYRPRYVVYLTNIPLSADSWQLCKARAQEAEAILRKELSDEYIDHLLHAVRIDKVETEDMLIRDDCLTFIGSFLCLYDRTGGRYNHQLIDSLVSRMEKNVEKFPAYANSALYAKRHAERYKNKKDDSSFFFI